MKQRIDNVLKNTRFSRWEVVISDLVDSFPELTVVFIIIHCSVAEQETLKKLNLDSMSRKLHRRHFITPKYCNNIIVKVGGTHILKALIIIKLKSYLYCNIRVNKIITATIIVSNGCTPNLRSLMRPFSVTGAFSSARNWYLCSDSVSSVFYTKITWMAQWNHCWTQSPNFQLLLVIINMYM